MDYLYIVKYLFLYKWFNEVERIIYNPFLNHKEKIDKINQNKNKYKCIASDCSKQESPNLRYPIRECVLDICIWKAKGEQKGSLAKS